MIWGYAHDSGSKEPMIGEFELNRMNGGSPEVPRLCMSPVGISVNQRATGVRTLRGEGKQWSQSE